MIAVTKKQILGGLSIYFALRLFSYFFSPGTPLYFANPINWVISIGILLLTIYFLLLKDPRGWLIIATEIILGGAGSFLEIKGISLRTLLLITSMTIFCYQQYHTLYPSPKRGWAVGWGFYIFLALYAVVGMSFLRGYYAGHDLKLILADTVPYLFFLYYFPLKQLLLSEKFRQIGFSMLIAAIIGNFIFTYFTLAGFSSKIFVLQDSYYHWFRDIAGGKITDYGTGFFRILLNEQLLIVPLLLSFITKTILSFPQKRESRQLDDWIPILMGMTLLPILTINLTRIYLVALSVGILSLSPVAEPLSGSLRGFVSIKNWRRWLAYSASAFIFFIIIFTFTHLATTKGKSFGWEYLGLRLQSITLPQTEDSSLSRMLLLPKILEKIKLHPLLGSGLGDTVTVYSPIFKENITTPHFDWGYLEIITETGLLGLLAWGLIIGYLILNIKQNRDLLAPVIALLVINITSPALFHVLGVILIVYIFSLIQKPQLN
jgi:hypothetical protein